MGDIFRDVEVCGLNHDGDTFRCEKVRALVDSGATQTVVAESVMEKLGSGVIRGRDSVIEGRRVPNRFVGVTLDGKNCDLAALVVAVDDKLVARAGTDPSGQPAQVILGHDYLQRKRASIRFGEREENHSVSCPPARRTRGKK